MIIGCGRSVSDRCLMSFTTPTTVIHCGAWSGRGRPNITRPPIGSRSFQ